ncbi:DUF2723 domain-containing protein [Anaerolineae bacterium CFX9]|nr:DUF2723 domain-containing protein [Anaerolineae bacterium CFX9]
MMSKALEAARSLLSFTIMKNTTALHRYAPALVFLIALLPLTGVYLSTLQTIPNGSEHYFMIDVGETQTVLNVWGTLHATGYPHYVITGAALVSLLRGFGIDAATAPAVVSLLWMLAALAMIYALLLRFRLPVGIAAAVILIYGVTRTVWIHAVIAEIYALTLLICAALYWLALKPMAIERRLLLLSLLGGIGVAHHRAVAMLIPALLIAAAPEMLAAIRRKPVLLVACLALGLLGFAPYAYLPLRAQAGAAWVYGEPGTWAGLWDQFMGREAERFIGAPETLAGILANFGMINEVLLTDVSVFGILAGIVGLLIALRQPETRRAAFVLIVGGLTAYLFHGIFYTDILSALILIVTLSLAVGWGLLAHWLMTLIAARWNARTGTAIAAAAALAAALALVAANREFITGLTTDPTGLQTIALAEDAPPGSTLMLAWGARHFAVGFARDVLGELPYVRLVDHKADFAALLAAGERLVTPEYTFYNQPVTWWQEQIGAPVVLNAVAPRLVQITTTPELGARGEAVEVIEAALDCTPDRLIVHAAWGSARVPDRDLSVFVHLIDADGAVLAQDDQVSPVYRLRPLTSFAAGEIVRDVYALPRLANSAAVRFGLYESLPEGGFLNTLTHELPVRCEA